MLPRASKLRRELIIRVEETQAVAPPRRPRRHLERLNLLTLAMDFLCDVPFIMVEIGVFLEFAHFRRGFRAFHLSSFGFYGPFVYMTCSHCL